MLLTITTTHRPATDLGYLLHKHPARLQSFGLAFGQAHVCYPEATDERCTAALLLEIDPIGLVRGRGATLDQYVNDRPYVASSFLSVALAEVFRSALAGNCKERPALVDQPLPLVATIAALPCRGGDEIVARLFAPLGYAVETVSRPLDHALPGVGREPLSHRHPDRHRAAARSAGAPLRPHPGPRQRQTLLRRRCRGREAAAARRGRGWPTTRSAT